MKVLIRCMLTAFIVALNCHAYAQKLPSSLKGKVLTSDLLPADAATIVLLRAKDSSIVNSAIISKTGLFEFANIKADSYLLLVTKFGYDKYYAGPYTVAAGQALAVNDITLSPVTRILNEVTVTTAKPDVEVKPGKIILNVQNSLMSAGSSAYEILRQSPGVRVDNNDNISIIGRQAALITIDGKPTNLSGEDLGGILKSMQGNTIDHIELISGGSAKYDASTGGIVNIVMKKGKNVGANATITATGGYGKYFKDNEGIVFNYRTETFNVFGNYGFSYNKTFHNYVTDRDISLGNTASDYHVDYMSTQVTYNSNINFGGDYFLSPNHTIGFLVNGYVRSENLDKHDNLKISNQGVLDSVITANSYPKRHFTSLNYNLNYRGKLDKAGSTLSADVNYTTYDRSSSEYITNSFYDPSGDVWRAPLLLQNLSPSNIHIWLSKIDFSGQLTKDSKLEAGIKNSSVTSNNDLIFGPQIGGVYTSDPLYSDHFLYTEKVNFAYVNYEARFNKFDFAAGLRAEQTTVKGNSTNSGAIINNNYLNFFPHLLLSYTEDDKHNFSLNYQRGIQRPAYEDINPFLYYSDLYDFRSGNPNLKPEYSNSVELSYNYNRSFIVTLYGTEVSNAYDFLFYEQNDTSKVNVATHRNLGKVHTYGARFFVPVAFTNWWNADFNLDASYQRYVSYPVNGNLNKGTQDIIFSSTQHFIISNTISAEFSGSYESANFYGVSEFKPNYSVNAGIGKQLFNKMGSIRLNMSDIFNTKRDRATTNYENLDMSTTDKRESQVVRLTFTWRFGKTTVKGTSDHNTGNEDEQKRIKSSISN